MSYARRLADGRGVPKDVRACARYAKLAADQDDVGGLSYFANCLLFGRGVARDK